MLVSFDDLLNLPQIRVVGVAMTEAQITLQVEHAQHFAICHKCGERATEFFRDGEKLVLRHLPIFNRPVYLSLQTKRYRCLRCGGKTTTTQHEDWYDTDAHCTKAFAEFLLLELVNSTVSDVARKHLTTYEVLRGVLTRYVRDEVDWSQFKHLRVLGVDEISLLKGHRDFVTIVSTQDDAGHPVVLPRAQGAREEASRQVPEKHSETLARHPSNKPALISTKVLPMPSRRFCRRPNWSRIGFTSPALYRAALDQLRTREMKELKKMLKKEQYAGLKGVMWILRHNFDDLSEEDKQLLELLFECSPALRQAHALREKLTAIFERKLTKEEATRALSVRIEEVRGSGPDCFDKFLGTLETWMDEITNYFISRLSSGWVEGLNNKIKVLKRRSYGLKNIGNLFRRIQLDLSGAAAFA